MPRFLLGLAVALALCAHGLAAAPSVAAKDGNILLTNAGGEVQQLTSAGHDSAPVLSPDGRWIVFVRAGEHRDRLLVNQHRYFIGGGSYDWFWLFRPDGSEVGPVGEGTEMFDTTFGGGR